VIKEKFRKTQSGGGHAEKQNDLIGHPSVNTRGLMKNDPKKEQRRELQHTRCENTHEKIHPVFEFGLKSRVESR
jgi:hypothetical protein